ncbi:hypothetical protein ABH944_000832 [Caballeronia udeis]|uniref:Transposase n=1 Tax=Caballeronia udeis TaxID=1232866 RepID=A0ABW8MAV5_9BURK
MPLEFASEYIGKIIYPRRRTQGYHRRVERAFVRQRNHIPVQESNGMSPGAGG